MDKGLRYAELAAMSNFSFLQGASHPQEIVWQAYVLGYCAIGIADLNTLSGQVRAHKAAKELGIKFLPSARLHTLCGFEVIAYPRDRSAYGALSQTLSRANLRGRKGACRLELSDVMDLATHHKFVWLIVPPIILSDDYNPVPIWRGLAQQAVKQHGLNHVYVLLAPYKNGDDEARWQCLMHYANNALIKPVAGSDALYHCRERRALQDVLTCIRLHLKVNETGYRLMANAERFLYARDEIERTYACIPDALSNIKLILDTCDFSLDELAYQYPDDSFDPHKTPQALLEDLTYEGARQRFPNGIPDKLTSILKHELSLINQLDYAPYFLTVYDIVRYARAQRILCQGRGSAANSAVCYCLGITSVDPSRLDLLFERFVSVERNEPPDIDIDFENERREEVIQYIYRKYGRHRAGIAATVITYRSRSAIREVAKVMGLSSDIASTMLSLNWGSGRTPPDDEHLRMLGLDPDDGLIRMVLDLAGQLIGFPRHLSQHVGGFVITRAPLDTLVPIANAAMKDRTFIEWDKDDLDAMGMLKIDILALGMLTAIRRSFDLLAGHYDIQYDLASVPAADKAVYDMLCRAESVGVFQVESRAQMNMLPRLKPRDFYDLVIQVAIVRPGPIQGDMVHPYLRRRNGEEIVDYPSPELHDVLGKTLGVPLFQEQAMRIAVVAAGFTPAEADQLRRAMATFRKTGLIENFATKFLTGMQARGYSDTFAARCFRQIEGFGEYGFPESHAASFALLVYVSAWLKCHYPAAFTASLLNTQPMGFYAPAQLVREAQRQGVEVLPVCVNKSHFEADLEPMPSGVFALRLGLNQVSGLQRHIGEQIITARQLHGFDGVRDCARRAGLSLSALERLARADGFSGLGLSRRQALWAARSFGNEAHIAPLPLFAVADMEAHADDGMEETLPPLSLGEEVVEDYASLRLSLKAHPVGLLRQHSASKEFGARLDQLVHIANGRSVRLAGLVICRQRPGSAQGVVFVTLEDEAGTANIVIWPDCFETYRRAVIGARLMVVEGRVQRQGVVVHVVAQRIIDRTNALHNLLNSHDIAQQDLPRGLRGKAHTGRRTPREMPWRGDLNTG